MIHLAYRHDYDDGTRPVLSAIYSIAISVALICAFISVGVAWWAALVFVLVIADLSSHD